MSEEQSAGEAMAFGVIDQANLLAKSARMTQQALELQIEELVAMEAQVNAAVQSMHGVAKSFEGERAKLAAERTKLAAVSPTLQQNAVWAVQEAIREQGSQIRMEMRSEVREGMLQPLQDIQAGAGHVRKNVWETKRLYVVSALLFGMVLGFGADRYWVDSRKSHLEAEVDGIHESMNTMWSYLQRQDDQKKAGSHPGKGK